jgi:HPt (histidine-containing phosphotransfer) domain-containing protein
LFWAELAGDLAELENAIARFDAPGARRWAHRIKGASLMFGQEALGEAAAALEERTNGVSWLDASHMAEAAKLVERLIVLFHEQRGAWASSHP